MKTIRQTMKSVVVSAVLVCGVVSSELADGAFMLLIR